MAAFFRKLLGRKRSAPPKKRSKATKPSVPRRAQPFEPYALSSFDPAQRLSVDPKTLASLAGNVVSHLAAKPKSIPRMPDAAMRALGEARSPNAEINTLVRLINRDPPLATNLLRVANSPIGGERSVNNTRDAITRLGLREVSNLISTASLLSLLHSDTRQTPRYQKLLGSLTCHAVSSAFSAGKLALERPGCSYELAFTGGLLHDIGKLIALPILEPLAPKKGQEAEALIFAVLERIHAGAGGVVARAWGLPESIQEICEGHHNPGGSETSKVIRLVSGLDELRWNIQHREGLALEVLNTAKELRFSTQGLKALAHDVEGFSHKAAQFLRV